MAGKRACTELACGLAFASRSVPNYSRRPAGRPFPCASTEISIGDTGVSPLRHCDSPPLSRSTQGMIRARRLMVLRATVVEMRLTPCICAISPRSRASRVPTSAMRRAEDNRPSRGRIALENRRMAHYGLLELRVQVRLDGQRRFDLCPIACDAFLLLQAADAAWSRRFLQVDLLSEIGIRESAVTLAHEEDFMICGVLGAASRQGFYGASFLRATSG
jgi:hypothetical protein